MINQIRTAIYKHGYLIIIAAWLYTISFIFTNYWSYHASPEKVKSKIEKLIHAEEKKINAIISDTSLIESLIHPIARTEEKRKEEDAFGLFIYQIAPSGTPEIRYWSSNKMEVSSNEINKPIGTYFVTNPHGSFIIKKNKLVLKQQQYYVFAVLPVKWTYFIQNKYFKSDFASFPGLANQYDIGENKQSVPVLTSKGEYLFSISLKEGKAFISYDVFTIVLRVLAILLIFIFLHFVSEDLVISVGFYKGISFLFLWVVLLRLAAYLFPFPFNFSKLPLFDPTIYASNFLHPSLGDLLINAIIFFWLLLFFKNHQDESIVWNKKQTPFFTTIVSLSSLTIFFFIGVNIVNSLVRDSTISFDVSNFFSLSIYSIISFVVLCLLALNFFYLSQVLYLLVLRHGLNMLVQLLTVILTGFAVMLILAKRGEGSHYLVVLFWLLGYLLILNWRKKDLEISFIRTPYFIFWVMFFAMSIAVLVMYQNKVVEYEQRKRIAEKLAIQTDPSGENLLYIAATNFDNDFFNANFHRFNKSEYTNKYIKDSLINQNFSGYLNKYETHIYTYDSLFRPLYNDDSLSYASIKTIVLNKAIQTEVPDLYRYENSKEGNSYIYQKEVIKEASIQGYIYVLMKLKKYKSEALYPELFNQSQDAVTDLNTNYAYAVYLNGNIINHFRHYNFPSKIDLNKIPAFEFTYQNEDDYSELWFNTGNNRQVVVAKRNTWVIELVTLIAYLFCSFIVIIFCFDLGNQIIRARFKWQEIKQLFQINIKTQIQATIIFVSLFSFIVIGIASISFFIFRFNTSNEERLSNSIQVMANELNLKIKAISTNVSNELTNTDLEKSIAEISDSHNVDINYFNEDGNLIISSQPYIYNKHLLTEKMQPNAFTEMKYNHRIRFLQSETIGSFKYLSVYVPLINEEQHTYGYLNIPYLNSQSELNQEISGFMATLINLNAFIFLLAGAIAFLLTNRITSSLSLIGATMMKMNVGTKNEEINWSRNDEIGVLVKEYNTMVRKLDKSVQSLAQSEREGAWREMARQVAHEIKNPLTPMKLSIQFLQKSIREGSPNVKQLSETMAATLIEQIEQLAKIAGDFSQFANIGNVHLEKFDISDIINSLILLHANNEQIHFDWQKDDLPAIIYADRVQINRLLTNLFKNSIEAGFEQFGEVYILIQQRTKEQSIEIAIQDRSGGIPDDVKKHIFSPNFTTKSSGSGLGLAICKGIVEKANGRIEFSSIDGLGTTFTITLPLHSERL